MKEKNSSIELKNIPHGTPISVLVENNKQKVLVDGKPLSQRGTELLEVYDELLEKYEFTPNEEKLLAKYATSSRFIRTADASDLSSLVDLDADELTDEEWTIFRARLKQGIKRIVDLRATYVAGPYITNRATRRAAFAQLQKLVKKGKRRGATGDISVRTLRLTGKPSIIRAFHIARRLAMKNLGLYNTLGSYVKPKTETVEVGVTEVTELASA